MPLPVGDRAVCKQLQGVPTAPPTRCEALVCKPRKLNTSVFMIVNMCMCQWNLKEVAVDGILFVSTTLLTELLVVSCEVLKSAAG